MKIVLKMLALYIVYAICVDLAYAWLLGASSVMYSPPAEMPSVASVISICLIAPLWEEAAYRYAPLSIAKNLGKEYLMPVAVLSSMCFGWGHGYGQLGIIYQGVFGLFLSYTFIKTNYSYIHSVLLHSIWNTLSIFYLEHITFL